MKVRRLILKNFRNLEPLALVPHEHLNLIVGPNASGKTNLCEALVYASRGTLLKGERQRELIGWNGTSCTLELEVDGERIVITLNGAARGKRIELGGETVTHGKLFEAFKVLVFTPDDLRAIKGGPARRRRLVDQGLIDLAAAQRHVQLAYDQVVRRKSALLARERVDPELLSVYDQELLRYGARLVAARRAYLEALNAQLTRLHPGLSSSAGRLVLRYHSEVPYGDDPAAALRAALARARARERVRRQCLVGPHRDDVCFELEGMDLRRYGSQGQQKSALIAFKLAQLALFRERLEEEPVLVLDDVLSELDPERTRLLLDALPRNLQVFLTETELRAELAARAGKVFYLERGRVRELAREAVR